MIENLQEKLHQRKSKQSKGSKICASVWWEIQCEKYSKTFCKIFGRKNIQNQNNTKRFSNPEDIFNPHMHKIGPWGPKHYIFGDNISSKNDRKIKFYVFLHFTARKHMILTFYLKWTKFIKKCEFVPI